MKISDLVIYDSESDLEYYKKGEYSSINKKFLEKGNEYSLATIISAYFNFARLEAAVERKKKGFPGLFSSDKKVKERKNEVFEVIKEEIKDCKKYIDLLDDDEKTRLKKIVLKNFDFIKPLSFLANTENDFIKSIKKDVLPEWSEVDSSIALLASKATINPLHISLVGMLNENLNNLLFENLDFAYLVERTKSISAYFISDIRELIDEYKSLYYGSKQYKEVLEIEKQYIKNLSETILNNLRNGESSSELNKFLKANSFSILEKVSKNFKQDAVEALYECFEVEKNFKCEDYCVYLYAIDKDFQNKIDINKLYRSTYFLVEEKNSSNIILDVNKYISLLMLAKNVFDIKYNNGSLANASLMVDINKFRKNLKENNFLREEIKSNKNVDEKLNNFLIEKNDEANQIIISKAEKFFDFIIKPLLEMEAGKSTLFLDEKKGSILLNIDIKPEFKNMVEKLLNTRALKSDFDEIYESILEHEKMRIDVNSSQVKGASKIRKF